jgi:tRNASer (uridine44-2'-O)-methyltransferase
MVSCQLWLVEQSSLLNWYLHRPSLGNVILIGPIELEPVFNELIHNPELTSQLILRAEIQGDDSSTTFPYDEVSMGDQKGDERICCYTLVRKIRRKLLPRRPDRDLPLLQDCLLFREEESLDISLLVLRPLLHSGQTIPYYHPDVSSLAIRYREGPPESDGVLTVEVTPKEAPKGGSRLYNTCVILLQTVWKHCWGIWTGYKKRVVHDTVVDRATYQDLYWTVRERHKGLVLQWAESTDPVKNVFEVRRCDER